MNLIEEYIIETPDVLKKILQNSKSTFENINKLNINKLILTGSGTSYHSALQISNFLRKLLKIEVMALYPFQVTEDLFLHGDVTLIGISQGGSSYSTFEAMKTAKDNNATIVSMTGKAESLLDTISDFSFPIKCGEELAGAKTKGYHSTKLNLILFGLEYALVNKIIDDNQYKEVVDKLLEDINQFKEIYRLSKSWVENNEEKFRQATDIRIIGSKKIFGDVLESALKLLETLRIPVSGYEYEEFVHGIYNAIDESSTIIFIDDGTEDRLNKLRTVLSEWTENIFYISNSKDNNPDLFLPISSKEYSFNYMIPIQLLCSIIPETKGIDPVEPKDPTFHKRVNSKKL